MTLFEVAFGKEPDLRNVHEWGEKVYVRIEGGTKLGGRVQEGCWLGIGLKQAGRWWYQKLVEIMTKLGFQRCEGNQAVFFRCFEKTEMLIIMLVHVDDCTIMGINQAIVERFKAEIAKHVDIADMGDLHWILGIEVHQIQEEKKLLLSQKAYIEAILQHYGFEDLKPTYMDPAIQLSSVQSPSTTEEYAAMKHILYHEAIRSLMYATLGTHPDICYAVQTVSKFNNKPIGRPLNIFSDI